jgi:hypothetical protein
MQESALTTEISAPLPLRARGVLEILDVAIKLYRRYFWVLFAWSALVILPSFIPGVSYGAFLLTPLMIGATACCIAAAVRGQPAAFKQCWQFTRPRYGSMLGMYILAFLVVMLAIFGLMLVCGLIFGLGFLVFRDAPATAQIVATVTGMFLLLVVFTLGGTAAMIWQSMVPIVVCMEADKAGSQALARAYELLRGHWVRVTTLMSVLVLGAFVLTAILGISGAMIAGGVPAIQRIFSGGQTPNNALLALFGGLALLWVTMYVLWSPIFYITLALFYLDIRIRKEALDLEWSAHVTAPQAVAAQATAPAASLPVEVQGTSFGTLSPTSFAGPTTPLSPTSATANLPYQEAPWSPAAPSSSPLEQPVLEQPLLEQPTLEQPANPVANDTAVITCPQCGATAPSTQTYCMRCGTLLQPVE